MTPPQPTTTTTPLLLLTTLFLTLTSALPSALSSTITVTTTAPSPPNLCPTTTEYACFDVINSSYCLELKAANGTAAELAACVDYPGGMSDLPGAAKLCRCPGCHAKFINDAIARLFPPPCA